MRVGEVALYKLLGVIAVVGEERLELVRRGLMESGHVAAQGAHAVGSLGIRLVVDEQQVFRRAAEADAQTVHEQLRPQLFWAIEALVLRGRADARNMRAGIYHGHRLPFQAFDVLREHQGVGERRVLLERLVDLYDRLGDARAARAKLLGLLAERRDPQWLKRLRELDDSAD